MPMSQLISRGRRKAPVKKMRSRCTTMAATKTSAAQWWIWRITSPARTSKLRRITESYAADTVWPRRGSQGPE